MENRETGVVASGLAVLVWRSDGLLSVETVNSKFELEHEQALEYWAKTAVMMWVMMGSKCLKHPTRGPLAQLTGDGAKAPALHPVMRPLYSILCI